jgi:hypothetical protein
MVVCAEIQAELQEKTWCRIPIKETKETGLG